MAGSSPRVRGKRRARAVETCEPRIIPARAGQTVLLFEIQPGDTDHPRACGANACRVVFARACSGSSPRVRGKLEPVGAGHERFRIIPARAGQTSAAVGSGSRRSDHPRACGANVRVHTMLLVRSGSSPRVRGKLIRRGKHFARNRIIPARAGQTSPQHHPSSQLPDHPRACGANHQ